MPEAAEERAARGRLLPALARLSLEQAFAAAGTGRGWNEAVTASWLLRPAATFVTLRAAGALRGCVGSVEASRPVAEDVWENARGAAFRDGRFLPLIPGDLPALAIEVSVLSPLEPLGRLSRAEAERLLRPGIDGAVIGHALRRGIFLPQVWEHLSTPDRFLAELARKAGLTSGPWPDGVELARFTVEKWEEVPGACA